MAQQQQQPGAFDLIIEAIDSIEPEWPSLTSNPLLRFAAEREWFLQACEKSTYARDAAAGNIDATKAAFRNVAAVGVTLDPARKLAYIVPRDNKMVYDLSYMGLIDVAIRARSILWAQAAIVHENDTFELQGYDRPPMHTGFNPFKKAARGPIVGAYVVVKTLHNDYLTNALELEELDSIRDRSAAWKKRDPKRPGSGGPWETDWAEMAKKSCVKNGWKYWPHSEAGNPELLARAIHYLNTDGGQGIDLTPADASRTLVEIWSKKVSEAPDAAGVASAWADARAAFKEANDAEGLGKVREVVARRNRALGVAPPPPPAAPPPPAEPPAPKQESWLDLPAVRRILDNSNITAAQRAVAKLIAAASTVDALEATGPRIDALSEAEQGAMNALYNLRLKALDPNADIPD